MMVQFVAPIDVFRMVPLRYATSLTEEPSLLPTGMLLVGFIVMRSQRATRDRPAMRQVFLPCYVRIIASFAAPSMDG